MFGQLLKISYRGKLLSGRFISEDGNTIVVKLLNGYNISLPMDRVEIETVEEKKTASGRVEEPQEVFGTGDKQIIILHTGGTIASRVDYHTGAVSPVEDLRYLMPALKDMVNRVTVHSKVIENILSESMLPSHWIKIAREIGRHLNKYDGVVVTHGTDTMTYTGSALSFMFQKQAGPIILTGSQRSSDRPSSDAFHNLEGAIMAASTPIGEVCISFHAGLSDNRINILRAVRSRKMHSTRRDAIRSAGNGIIARWNNGSLRVENIRKPPDSETILRDRLDERVGIYYFSPLSTPEDLINASNGKRAIVIMATGLGHIGDRMIDPVRELADTGVKVLISTQTIFGAVNLNVYSTGRRMLQAGAISVGRTLPEVAAIKAMWALANVKEEQFENVMRADLRGENPERETTGQD